MDLTHEGFAPLGGLCLTISALSRGHTIEFVPWSEAKIKGGRVEDAGASGGPTTQTRTPATTYRESHGLVPPTWRAPRGNA